MNMCKARTLLNIKLYCMTEFHQAIKHSSLDSVMLLSQ